MLKGMRPSARQVAIAPLASLAFAGLTLATLGQASAVYAQDAPQVAPAGEPLVTLDVRDAKLQAAVNALGLDNVVVQKALNQDFLLVTVKMTNRPLSQVLEAIADSAGAVLTKKYDIYYLRPRGMEDSKPVPAAPAPIAVAAPATAPRRGPLQLAKIKLNFVIPSDFKIMLENPTMGLLVMEGKTPEQLGYNPLPKVVQFPSTTILPNGPFNNAPAPAPAQENVQGTAGSAAGRDSGDGADARGQGLGGGGRFGGGGGGGFQGGGFQGGGFQGGGQQGGGQQGGQGQNQSLRPQGIRNIISNDADNSLLIQYEDVEDLNQLREIVRLLDVAPKQVLIKVEFVAVQLADEESFGIDWQFSPSSNIDAVIPPQNQAQSTFALAYASGNAVANLRAALRKRDVNIIQSPIISTTNNRPASINVSTTITTFQQQNIVTGNGQIIAQTLPLQINASNSFNVTPHINGDNSISMVVAPQLQAVDPQANGSFNTTTQALFTTRRIQNGETMVLGGFINKQTSRQEERVPILSDLPLIGQLFRQRNKSVTGSETLVFITPQIIEDRAQGAIGTAGASPASTP